MAASRARHRGLSRGLASVAIVLTFLPVGAPGSWSASMFQRVVIGGTCDASERPAGEDDDDEDGDADRHEERAAKGCRPGRTRSMPHAPSRRPAHPDPPGAAPAPRSGPFSAHSPPLRC